MKEFQAADRYARSFFDLASAQGNLDEFSGELARFKEALEKNEKFSAALRNPLIKREEKRALVREILAKQASLEATKTNPFVEHFLSVLIEKNRTPLFFQIAERVRELVNESKGIQEATVFSARPVDSDVRDGLQAVLRKITNKKILLKEEMNPALLGGLQVRIANRIVDGSLRSRLDSLKSALLGAIK